MAQSKVSPRGGLSYEEEKVLVHLLEKQRKNKPSRTGYNAAASAATSGDVQPMVRHAKVGASSSDGKRPAPDHVVEDEWLLEEEDEEFPLDSLSVIGVVEDVLECEAKDQMPPYYADKGIYFPNGIKDFNEWSKTLLMFPSMRAKHLDYSEFFMKSVYGSPAESKELTSFGKWVIKRWASGEHNHRMQQWTPKHQAMDFGHYLQACDWENRHAAAWEKRAYVEKVQVFKRTFKGLVP